VKEETEDQPTSMNAFELISLNQALNLENLFEAKEVSHSSPVFLANFRFPNFITLLLFEMHYKKYKSTMILFLVKNGRSTKERQDSPHSAPRKR
jgi:hypothetical protein